MTERSIPDVEPDRAAGEEYPRVLVYDPDRDQGLALAGALRRSASGATIAVLTARGPCRDLRGDEIDVCIANLAGEHLDGLSLGAELSAHFPWIETVFWFDDPGAAAAEAARNLGIKRIVPLLHLTVWLDAALVHLARIARARRQQIDSEKGVPPLPLDGGNGPIVPLLEAERRFREAYLRRIVSESENHADAARKAGLAYTTFCSMLRKLDVVG